MSVEAQAKSLSEFLMTLFGKEGKVYIFPCLSEAKLKDVLACKAFLPPAGLHGRQLVYFPSIKKDEDQQWNGQVLEGVREVAVPRKVVHGFSRTARSTHPALVTKLNDFVAHGYDIYFCANPLTFNHRSQRTVARACHIVLESDDDATPIAAQKAILDAFADSMSAMVYSGNRSVHALVRLDPPIPNRCPVTWKTKHRLRIPEEPDWSQYKSVAAHWINKLKVRGLHVDAQVANDCSRLTRLPGFAHSKTGKPSEVLFLNPTASFDWFCETEMTLDLSDEDHLEQSTSTVLPDGTVSPDILSPDFTIDLHPDCSQIEPLAPSADQPMRTPAPTFAKPERRTSVSNVTDGVSFLDDLRRYDALTTIGIPKRHTRRSLHRVMFTAARTYGMTETQMADEWRRIVTFHPENIGCSVDSAIRELLASFRTNTDFSLFMPNTRCLPDFDEQRAKHLKDWLASLGCTCTSNVLKIIRNVLWNCIRTLPFQCQDGHVGLKSAVLHRTCTGKGGYKAALAWMGEHNIVRLTDEQYAPGRKTRQYFINIPLLLYAAGFETQDLDWSHPGTQKTRDGMRDGLFRMKTNSEHLHKLKRNSGWAEDMAEPAQTHCGGTGAALEVVPAQPSVEEHEQTQATHRRPS